MLNELCQELRNWFDRDQPRICGAFEIKNNRITDKDFLDVIKPNQYFRISGSVLNDGIYKYSEDLDLIDELFVGTINLMAIPKAVIELSNEIETWKNKYGEVVASPYASESFGGYSYTKTTNNGSGSWQSVFAAQLNQWRKI